MRHIFSSRPASPSLGLAGTQLAAEELRALHALHADSATRLQEAITEMFASATVTMVSLEETTFTRHTAQQGAVEYAASFSAHQPQAGRLELGDGLSGMLLDAVLGCKITPASGPRPMSDIEMQLVHGAVDTLLMTYAQAWREHVPCRFARDAGETPAAGEAVYAATYSVTTGGCTGRLSILLRLPAWSDVLHRLSAPAVPEAAPARNFGLLDAIGDTTLTARAMLGSTRLNIGDFLSLRPGDVICLDQAADAPVDVHVGNRARLSGQARIQNGKYVVTVERTVRGEM